MEPVLRVITQNDIDVIIATAITTPLKVELFRKTKGEAQDLRATFLPFMQDKRYARLEDCFTDLTIVDIQIYEQTLAMGQRDLLQSVLRVIRAAKVTISTIIEDLRKPKYNFAAILRDQRWQPTIKLERLLPAVIKRWTQKQQTSKTKRKPGPKSRGAKKSEPMATKRKPGPKSGAKKSPTQLTSKSTKIKQSDDTLKRDQVVDRNKLNKIAQLIINRLALIHQKPYPQLGQFLKENLEVVMRKSRTESYRLIEELMNDVKSAVIKYKALAVTQTAKKKAKYLHEYEAEVIKAHDHCFDCIYNRCVNEEDCCVKLCSKPHLLVWFKFASSYLPAKILGIDCKRGSTQFSLHVFGDIKGVVRDFPYPFLGHPVYLLTRDYPATMPTSADKQRLESANYFLNQHIELLKKHYGDNEVWYADTKTVWNGKQIFLKWADDEHEIVVKLADNLKKSPTKGPSSSVSKSNVLPGGNQRCQVCLSATIKSSSKQKMCLNCRQFMGLFLAEPKKYKCKGGFGQCQLNLSDRCKFCWINKISVVFKFTEHQKSFLFQDLKVSPHKTPARAKPAIVAPKKPITFKSTTGPTRTTQKQNQSAGLRKAKSSPSKKKLIPAAGMVIRNVNCNKCLACLRADCGDCSNCKKKEKFGGSFKKTARCLKRACTNPTAREVKKPYTSLTATKGPQKPSEADIRTKSAIQKAKKRLSTVTESTLAKRKK